MRLSVISVTNGSYRKKTNQVSILYFRLQECFCVEEKILRNHEQWPGPNAHRGARQKCLKQEQKKKDNNKNDKGYNKSIKRCGGNSRTASLSDTSSQKFEREELSIGVLLGLRFENMKIKHPLRSSKIIWVTIFQGTWSTATK